MSLVDHLYSLFIIYILKHLTQNWLYAVTTIFVTPVVNDNGQSSSVFFVALIHWYKYIVKYFRFNYFILLTIIPNTISTGFLTISAKRQVFLSKCFSRIRLNLLFRTTWSRCISHTDHLFSFIIIYSSKHMIQTRLSAAIAIIVAPVLSDNRQ